jgi:hypothetical protein
MTLIRREFLGFLGMVYEPPLFVAYFFKLNFIGLFLLFFWRLHIPLIPLGGRVAVDRGRRGVLRFLAEPAPSKVQGTNQECFLKIAVWTEGPKVILLSALLFL